ncbi:MAG: DUF3747 domain-containing protein [Hydrococcus sp. Prado102]|jgi:hypothetical protein|nr:DUF3747 domain-containing protein [Hydrococcus sp. Prado102]
MKATKLTALLAFLTISSSSIGIDDAVATATFDEKQIDQNQIIAIARPYGRGKYDLLVIEQIPGKKQCWSESGSNPTLVDPLLLKFDFTGHCSRSTDSNGYSMRIEGRDLGLNYLLRIVERNGELFLVGTSRTSPNQADIVLGRTYGMKQGFMKIQLNPGWQFSKRSYQGKVLGHVYFSGDRTALDAANSSTTVAALPSNQNSEAGVSDSTPTTSNPTASPKPDTNSNPSNVQSTSAPRELTFTAKDPTNTPTSSTSRRLPSVLSSPASPQPSPSRSSVPLPSSLSSSPSSRRLPSVLSSPNSPLPSSPRSSVPLPSSPSSSPSSPSPSSVRSSNSLPLPPSISSGQAQENTTATPTPATASNSDALSPLPPPPQASNSQVVPRPTASPRGSLSDVMAVSPRPVPGGSNADVASTSVPTSNNYRVLVQASGSQQEQLRSRFPEAFRTFYQGQTMWQVGRFNSRENVDKTLQDLQTMGLEGVVLE